MEILVAESWAEDIVLAHNLLRSEEHWLEERSLKNTKEVYTEVKTACEGDGIFGSDLFTGSYYAYSHDLYVDYI